MSDIFTTSERAALEKIKAILAEYTIQTGRTLDRDRKEMRRRRASRDALHIAIAAALGTPVAVLLYLVFA